MIAARQGWHCHTLEQQQHKVTTYNLFPQICPLAVFWTEVAIRYMSLHPKQTPHCKPLGLEIVNSAHCSLLYSISDSVSSAVYVLLKSYVQGMPFTHIFPLQVGMVCFLEED